MEIKYIFAKKTKVKVCREIKEDGSVFLHIFNLDGSPHCAPGALIGSFGGVEAMWDRCVCEADFEKKMANWLRANSPEMKAHQRLKELEREAERVAAREAAFQALVAKGLPIEATYENIGILLRYLNVHNWGAWELPAMSIGYRCNQYDCDGKIASTLILDEPIDVDGVMITRFVSGAPHGHLAKYYRV